jgi:site-specific DNA-methyltransferase (adenine-specific)
VIPFEPLWEHYKRIIKPRGAIVLTAAQPFTSALVMSNPKMFRYSWIWEKNKATGHLSAKSQPMRKHEDVLVFAKQAPGYNPQGTVVGTFNSMRPAKGQRKGEVYGQQRNDYGHSSVGNYPKSIIPFPVPAKPIHPTQKPVELFEYLIRTYTNPGDVVLDNCMGSGTTAVACMNAQRDFVGFELDQNYHRLALDRIHSHQVALPTTVAPALALPVAGDDMSLAA